jgi:sec-independent protein translocase protein TatA
MAGLGTPEILIILVVVLLLFGSAKLPQLARSLGKSARILKAETKGLHEDGTAEADAKQGPAAADGAPRGRGALASGEPIEGVPVSDPGRLRQG